MKYVLFLFLVMSSVFAGEARPVLYMTSDPGYVTYYSIPAKDLDKFEIVYLEWEKYISKFKYGWKVEDGQWVKVEFKKEKPKKVVVLPAHIPAVRKSGGTLIIERKTISEAPYKK